MSQKEFRYWQNEFNRNPWGIVPDDRRHVQICMRLDRLANMQLTDPPKINIDELIISKYAEEYKKMKSLLYSNIEDTPCLDDVPWLETGQTADDLALEGQAAMQQLKTKYGLK